MPGPADAGNAGAAGTSCGWPAPTPPTPPDTDGAADFYAQLLQLLRDEGLPFPAGGSYDFAHFTGIHRATKDLDIFIRQADWERLAAVAARAGRHAELSFPHWLGKVLHAEHFVDVIVNSGNGLPPVDDWFGQSVSVQTG